MNKAKKFIMNTTNIKLIFTEVILINFPMGVINTISLTKSINNNP